MIVFMLVIPFAFWGINYYFGSGGDVSAIEVNGDKISLQEYTLAYQNNRQQWQSMLGQGISEEQEALLKQNTIDSLISRKLLEQMNDSIGVRVGDNQLTEMIRGIEAFQGVNGFDTYLYENAIMRMGFGSSAEFEAEMRADLATSLLQSALLQSSFITTAELEKLASLIQQERDINYAILSSDELKESIEVSDEDIAGYYETNTQEYMNPEQVRIAYVELSLQKLSAEIDISEDGLLTYYNANKALYDVEEQRSFKQLFIAKAEDATEEEQAKVKEEIQALHGLIEAGSSFEEAVESRKNDSSPYVEVIDQEYMTRGIMEQEIDDVLFALNEGELSEPIETESGMQLIRLEEIIGGVNTNFEEVREQVVEDYRLSIVEPEFADKADQLTNLAFEHPDTLDIIHEDLGLEIIESPFFDRQWQANQLLRDPKVVNASFSEDVLLAGNNSEPIEIEDNRLLVLRVIEHKPENKKPLEEVRDRIVTRIKFERAREQTRLKGEEIVENLKNDAALDEIAGENGFEWQKATAIKRNDPEIDGRILRTAFSVGRPRQGENIFGGDSLASGDYAIVVVEAVRDADVSAISEEERNAIKNQLESLTTNDSWAQLLKDLREKADIQIYENNI